MRAITSSSLIMILFANYVVAQQVIYVDLDATGENNGTSWQDAYVDLQGALADAGQSGEGTEIWIAEGTYKPAPPGGDRSATFLLPSGVAVYGGFAGTETQLEERDPNEYIVTLSGDLNSDDDGEGNAENSHHVVSSIGTDALAVLDGCTVCAGNADGAELDVGGGVFADNTILSLVTCRIERNTTSSSKASGVYATGSTISLDGCKVAANLGYGLATVAPISTMIRGCEFRENSLAGLLNNFSVPIYVVDSTFAQNNEAGPILSGGGMSNFGDGSILVNVQFIGNQAKEKGGGLKNEGDDVLLVNCIFDGNTSQEGANIFNSGRLDMINCTLTAGNTSSGIFGAGVYHASELLTVTNSILWGNGDGSEAAQIWQDSISPGEVSIDYSIVQGWTGKFRGVGNHGLDPLFVDPDGPDDIPGTEDDDLRLLPGSPAIDSGDNTAVPADALDLDGDGDVDEPVPFDLDGLPRFVDDPATKDTGVPSDDDPSLPIVDRGAYEFPHESVCDGDANGDGTVDPLDLGYILSRFGCEVGTGKPACDAADANGDGFVDPLDVGYVLARLGTCE